MRRLLPKVSYVSFCGCTLMPQDMLYEPEAPRIEDLISRCGLSAVFQPVVSFESEKDRLWVAVSTVTEPRFNPATTLMARWLCSKSPMTS
jgi:hypothetical protein